MHDGVGTIGADASAGPAAEHGVWRRWTSGPARMRRGALVRPADMAVVVIGLGARENLKAAVESVLSQGPAEVIVVNSGGGDVEHKLGDCVERVSVVAIDQPLNVGAARNIGIDASTSEHVAFLAGDCIALPGWVEGRMRAHRAGARAVGSAMAPANEQDDLCMAAYLMLFGSRSPRVRPAPGRQYGLSFVRDIFAAVGYFNTAIRIGEDSDFASRLAGRVAVSANPAVLTAHAAPASMTALSREMWARGARAARYQAELRSAYRARRGYHRALRDLWRQRVAMADRVGREVLGIEEARLRVVRRRIRPAAASYVAGVHFGLGRLERARELLQTAGGNAVALEAAQRAVRLDQESLPARLALVDCLRTRGSESVAELRAAMMLSAFDRRRQERLIDWLLERGMTGEARAFGELADICAPLGPELRVRLTRLPTSDAGAASLSQFA